MKYIILFSFLTGAIAQSYVWDAGNNIRRLKSPDKLENMIIWRLTNELDISTDQAEKFFPRFRKHRKSIEEIGKQEREMIVNIDRGQPNKKDVVNIIEEITKLRQNRIELEAEFVLSLDDVLDPDQMIRLAVFNHKMMKEMRGKMKDVKAKKNRHKKKDRKRGRRGF